VSFISYECAAEEKALFIHPQNFKHGLDRTPSPDRPSPGIAMLVGGKRHLYDFSFVYYT
jgi:hypothetical protein